MRYLFIIILISFSAFSQTDEEILNQVIQTVKSQNITTKSQALDALRANGMSELQARQLAVQRGISFDQFIKELFPIENSKNTDISENLEFDNDKEDDTGGH